MDERLNQLETNPGDWNLRCQLASEYFEAGRHREASSLMSAAPDVPPGDENLVFAATVIAAANPYAAEVLIDRHTQIYGLSFAVIQLKQKLGLGSLPTGSSPSRSSPSPIPPEPVAAEPVPARESESLKPVPPEPVPAAEEKTSRSTEEIAALEPEEASLAKENGTERTIILTEGDAVKVADTPPLKKEQIRAVSVAVIVHVILILALTFWTFSTPPPPPPQIVASGAPPGEESEIENRTLSMTKTRSASEVTSVAPVVTSDAFSGLAIPNTLSVGDSASMMSFTDGDISFSPSLGGSGSVSNMNGIPAGMRSRCTLAQRMERLRESGGEDRAELAVVKGLDFLRSKQDPATGAFGDEYTAGMSGLALLAFLGHCETPESFRYGDAVSGAALFLMNQCRTNQGKITNGKSGDHETYEHAIATYALAELFTMTNESGKEIPELEAVLRRAIDVSIKAQQKDGGWPYGFDRSLISDMSVSSWHIQALKAAHNSGRTFPGVQGALDLATTNYIPSIQDERGAFKYHATDRDGRPSLTGAALLSMQIWKGAGTLPFKKGLEFLTEKYTDPVPRMDSIFYATYYNTQLLFLVGGESWQNYNSKLQPWLLDTQNADGSWTMRDSMEDRQFYNTAWAILMLEVYYRYLPTTDGRRDNQAR